MQLTLTANQLAALSESRERLNKLVFWAVIALLIAVAASALYNIFNVAQPWLRLGQAWALGFLIYLFTPTLNQGVARKGTNEPSARFLLRTHEDRRRGYLWIRNRLILAVPSLVFSWVGIQQARPNAQLLAVSWPFLATSLCLLLVWIAFGRAAAKAGRDADDLRRSLEEA